MKAWEHLKTISHHKYLVMKNCFRVGLYKQGLLHDMSKYSPAEFFVGCKYYQGTRSPNAAEREARGYSEEKIQEIMDSQLPEEEFRRHCQVVIDNSGSLQDAYRQIDEILKGNV